MTDKKTETSQDDTARSKSPVLTTPADKRVPPHASPANTDTRSRSVLAPAALVLALAAAGMSGALWLQQRQAADTQADLNTRVNASESAATRVSTQMSEALGRLEAQEGRIQALESQLDEAVGVIRDLDEALRNMTDRGSELVLLNDVDHLATIAQQQLQLGGNVRNAIVALESAQAQLARANRPGLASLLQTINGDLDRLRAASTIDVAAFSRQLEELATLLTDAPLIMPDAAGRQAQRQEEMVTREQPAPTVVPTPTGEAPWWQRAWETARGWSHDAWTSVRRDLGQFIDVRRVDDASALLMSPDQAGRFRENLRTRVMTAQLALMMRQPEVWKTETEAIVRAVETRYDQASPLTRKALRLARGMADASIDARLPTVDNTLQALEALRAEQAGRLGGDTHGAATDMPGGEMDSPPTNGDAGAAGTQGTDGANGAAGAPGTRGALDANGANGAGPASAAPAAVRRVEG